MKTKNFPAKKVARQIGAARRRGEAVDGLSVNVARGVRTKINRILKAKVTR